MFTTIYNWLLGKRTIIVVIMACLITLLEAFDILPKGTWEKIMSILVSLAILFNRLGSKNDTITIIQELSPVLEQIKTSCGPLDNSQKVVTIVQEVVDKNPK